MNNIANPLTQISRWFAWIGGAMIFGAAALISLDVVFRALFKSTWFESYELSGYAFAISTSLGMAYALVTKAHIRIEVVYNLFAPRMRALLDILAFVSLAAVSVVLAWFCLQTVLQNAAIGARSNSSLAIPLVAPQALWLLGLAWFAVVSIVLSIAGLVWVARGKFKDVQETLGVSSLQEEISANVGISTAPTARVVE